MEKIDLYSKNFADTCKSRLASSMAFRMAFGDECSDAVMQMLWQRTTQTVDIVFLSRLVTD